MNNIEKYEKIVEENNNDMVELWIVYNMTCHENYAMLNQDEKEKLLCLIRHLWFKIEDISLDRMSDIVMENYEKALNEEITKLNIYNYM